MKRIRQIMYTLPLILAAVFLFSACERETEVEFRVVDYSYVLQTNTESGSEFAFYMYAYSFVKGPITGMTVSGSEELPARMVQADLYETQTMFGSFEKAVAPHTFNAVNERRQSVSYEVSHNLPSDKILGEIHVSDIRFDGRQVEITVSNVENANHYGFFVIPQTEIDGVADFYRARGGRPVLQDPAETYFDPDTGRRTYATEQVVVAEIFSERYEADLLIVPIAMYEASDGSRLIVESDKTIVIPYNN